MLRKIVALLLTSSIIIISAIDVVRCFCTAPMTVVTGQNEVYRRMQGEIGIDLLYDTTYQVGSGIVAYLAIPVLL